MIEDPTISSPTPDIYNDFQGHYIDPVEIVSSCIFIPIGLLTDFIYIRILIYHLRQGFKTHYQKIFFLCITDDICLHYSALIRVRLPTWGVHEWYRYIMTGFFPSFLGYVNAVFIQIQVVGTLLIAVNRATAVAFPHGYEKVGLVEPKKIIELTFWTRHTWTVCLIWILSSIIYCLGALTDNNYFRRFSWGYYLPYNEQNSDFTAFLDKAHFPLNIILTFITFVINLYTGVKLFFYRKEMRDKMNGREVGFYAVTLVQFLIQCVSTVDQIITNFLPIDKFWVFYEFAPVFGDLANFLPLWFFLLVSEETRQMVLGRKENQSRSSSNNQKKIAITTLSIASHQASSPMMKKYSINLKSK